MHEDFNQSKFEFCNAQKFIKKQNNETKNEWNFHHTNQIWPFHYSYTPMDMNFQTRKKCAYSDSQQLSFPFPIGNIPLFLRIS